jgi:hypothetical protein
MDRLISVDDFMQHLKQNDLLIVSRKDLLDSSRIELDLKRRDLMKKKDLSIKDVIDGKFLPIGTKSGIRIWIKEGKIKEDEVYKNRAGQIRILISAIKRLGYGSE